MHGGIQIGQLLIEQGVLTETQVQHMLKVQKMSHRPFGDLAARLDLDEEPVYGGAETICQ